MGRRNCRLCRPTRDEKTCTHELYAARGRPQATPSPPHRRPRRLSGSERCTAARQSRERPRGRDSAKLLQPPFALEGLPVSISFLSCRRTGKRGPRGPEQRAPPGTRTCVTTRGRCEVHGCATRHDMAHEAGRWGPPAEPRNSPTSGARRRASQGGGGARPTSKPARRSHAFGGQVGEDPGLSARSDERAARRVPPPDGTPERRRPGFKVEEACRPSGHGYTSPTLGLTREKHRTHVRTNAAEQG